MFISNDKVLNSEQEIANGFNNFFVNVGAHLARQIPPSKSSFADFLGEEVSQNFTFPTVTPGIIHEALSKLKAKIVLDQIRYQAVF